MIWVYVVAALVVVAIGVMLLAGRFAKFGTSHPLAHLTGDDLPAPQTLDTVDELDQAA